MNPDKVVLAAATFCLLASRAFAADPLFNVRIDYRVGSDPFSVCAVDLDGDGDRDLAVANYSSNTVSILKNNGDGTFAVAVNYGVGGHPMSVCAVDLDGDGDSDLAVANSEPDNVSILKNNGDGTFAAAVNYGAGGRPWSVCAADLDGDGDSDLAVGNQGSNNVSILKNNGDGTFAAAVNYGIGSQPTSVCAADLDGDGDNDLAVGNQGSNNVSILKNNGDGTFAAAVNYGVGESPSSICAADLDGDGDNDLAANSDSYNVSILQNNGDGTFAAAVNYGVGGHPMSVCAVDLDGDGDSDLAVANSESDNVSILQNNGDGTFAAAVNYGAGMWPWSVCAADLDGDGDSDLAVLNQGSNNVSVLINASSGSHPWPTLLAPQEASNASTRVTFSWSNLQQASAYQVSVSPSATMSNPVWTSVVTSTAAIYSLGPEFPVGSTYYWSVRALSGGGWGSYSPARSIHRSQSGSPLTAPVLATPANGSELSLPEDFSWTTVTGASSYEIQTAQSTTFSTVLWSTRVEANSAGVPASAGPTIGQTYYWRVRALAPGMESPWQNPVSFLRVSSIALPEAPTPQVPSANGSVVGPHVAFAWLPAARATSYKLVISISPDFPETTGKTWGIQGIHETTHVVTLGAVSTTLYWKVVGCNSAGAGPASMAQSLQYSMESTSLVSCTIVTPSTGINVPQDAVLLGSAIVAGQYSDTVTVRWLLDDEQFAMLHYAMGGEGFETPPVQIPTSGLGHHLLKATVVGGGQTVPSPLASFTVVSRTHGAASGLALTAGKQVLGTEEATTLWIRVLDSAGSLVEDDKGRTIVISVQGSGFVSPAQVVTAGGTASVTYTASCSSGDVLVLATSGGFQQVSIPITVRSIELERLKAEAGVYLDRLADLRWDTFDSAFRLPRSLNVSQARSFVNNAVPGDEQRLRRLNMFLRVVNHSYYFNSAAPNPGSSENHSQVPGVLALYDDAARSLGYAALVIVESLSSFDAAIDAGKLKWYERGYRATLQALHNSIQWGADEAFQFATSFISNRTKREQVRDWWDTFKTAASLIHSQYASTGLSSLAANPCVRGVLGQGMVIEGFVEPAQSYLKQVVNQLSSPSWVGGSSDAYALATVNAAMDTVYVKSTHYDWELNKTIEAFGMVSWINDVEDALSHAGGVMALFSVGVALNRVIEASLVWATGVDCQTIAMQIAGPGLMGVVADAVVKTDNSSGELAQVHIGSVFLLRTADAVHTSAARPLSSSRALKSSMDNATDRVSGYEMKLRELEAALAASDTTLVQSSLDSASCGAKDLLDGWGRLASIIQSTSETALYTYPAFNSSVDSLGNECSAAVSSCNLALAYSAEWLTSNADESLRLAARNQVQDAVDKAEKYQKDVVDFINELFQTPSTACLHVDVPTAPDRMGSGGTGTIHALVWNLGAEVAHHVRVNVVADTTQLKMLSQEVVSVDSIPSGGSFACSWYVQMLEREGKGDSATAVLGSVASNAADAISASSMFSIYVHNPIATGVITAPATVLALDQNCPNPFNPSTAIKYWLPVESQVTLEIYDSSGRLVNRLLDRERIPKGEHFVEWRGLDARGRAVSSGVYFYRLQAGKETISKKMVLLR